MQRFFYLLLCFFTLSSGLPAQTIRYVKATATGAGNGASWQDASSDLQAMINASDENNGDMIFVAAGTYRPRTITFSMPFSRVNAFTIQKNIKIFGGFPADGGDTLQRNWVLHKTILSGDMNENDQHGAEFNDDNTYHVLVTDGASVNAACVIDGFIITGGNADHPFDDYYWRGGGWYNGSSSPTVRNLTLTGNYAQYGGGWHNASGSPIVSNIEIRNNRAYSGGGWFSIEGKPKIVGARIWDNQAQVNGGGIYIYNTSKMALENLSIRGNTAERGGAVYQFNGTGSFLSSEMTGNVAQLGAGVYCVTASVGLVNCTIAGNAAESEIMWVSNGFVNFSNSIFSHNTSPTTLNPANRFFFQNSLVQNQSYPDTLGNLNGNLNPAFANPVSAVYSADPASSNATSQGDFSLLPGSPVIDKGSNGHLPLTWNIDLAGNNRIRNGIVDLGAFESDPNAMPVTLIDFSAVKSEKQTVLTWRTASEVNASHFEIERSLDAKSWVMVGIENAKSHENGTAGIRDYYHTDLMAALPVNFSGIMYYRLRMVDKDRTFSYSGIKSVLFEGTGDNTVFRAYPNPTSSGLVRVDFQAGQVAQLRIFNLVGREVIAPQTFEGSTQVDLSRMPKGIYMLHLRGAVDSVVKKLVVE